MSSASSLFVCYLLISFTGVVVANKHQSVSTDAIIALACVFGFLGTVILLSGVCFCVRKQRYNDNRRRQEKLALVSKLFKEQQEKNKQLTETHGPEVFTETSIPVEEGDLSDPVDEMGVEKQKYTTWRQSQVSPNVVLTNGAPITHDSRYVYRTRADTTRSISPTRISPGIERGRTRQRVVYTNGANTLNKGTVIMSRSKSAPAINRQHHRHQQYMEYVPGGPKPIFFTKSHFMAIKQPFSKKYLLPPTRTHYYERPAVKKVMYMPPPQPQPQRQVIEIQRPAPPQPQRQEVAKSNVYHIQYQPGPNQTVNYGGERDSFHVSNSTSHSPRIYTNDSSYQSQNSPIFITPDSNNSSNYVHYTTSQSNGKVIPATHQWYGSNIYVNRQESSNSDDVFMKSSNRVSYTTEARGGSAVGTVDADYTIVDFVESGVPDKDQNVRVLSTSTPRFPDDGHDASALQDLDNLLNSDGDSTASEAGSSSSSSNKSSKKNSSD